MLCNVPHIHCSPSVKDSQSRSKQPSMNPSRHGTHGELFLETPFVYEVFSNCGSQRVFAEASHNFCAAGGRPSNHGKADLKTWSLFGVVDGLLSRAVRCRGSGNVEVLSFVPCSLELIEIAIQDFVQWGWHKS